MWNRYLVVKGNKKRGEEKIINQLEESFEDSKNHKTLHPPNEHSKRMETGEAMVRKKVMAKVTVQELEKAKAMVMKKGLVKVTVMMRTRVMVMVMATVMKRE